MADLKHYTVINRHLIESLARQLNLPIDQERTTEAQVGLVGKVGLGIKKSRKQSPFPPDDPRLLPPIIEALRESGQLRVYRPESTSDFWYSDNDWYVHETAVAVPVLLPFDRTLPDTKYLPEAVTIWVLDPPVATLETQPKKNWLGPFVFIVQELESFPASSEDYISGISAIRIITEVVAKRRSNLFKDWIKQYFPSGGPDFHYSSYHAPGFHRPINDLRELGGIVKRPRKIETIYKIAYMTHQGHSSADRPSVRIGDILAYPLFIAE
jgi:hypothetical protein